MLLLTVLFCLAFAGSVLTDFTADDNGSNSSASTSQTSAERLIEEMGMFENYILGILTNYKQLPLDRLHKMLQLFVVSPRFDKSTEQLAAYLALLQTLEKVMCENGLYKICCAGGKTGNAGGENA